MRAKDADSTWALVVGIDTYDFDKIVDLDGAALDAVDWVKWLRGIEVPKDHILLHTEAKPSSKAAVADLQIPSLGCTWQEIWASFQSLSKHQGTRLFVCLMGHALYEPTGGRVFLTRDATKEELRNLGLDWFCAYLRSLRYTNQFVFLDGCLNRPYSTDLRPQFIPGQPIGVALKDGRDDIAQMFCSGASAGQLARELNKRGAFTSTLLRAINLEELDPRGVDVDPSDGTLRLRVGKIMDGVVVPAMGKLKLPQTPYYKPQGDTPGPQSLVDLSPTNIATLSVRVEPADDVSGVQRIVLLSADAGLRDEYPRDDATAVPSTIDAKVPVGMEIVATCAPKAGWATFPSRVQSVIMQDDAHLVFTLDGTTAIEGATPGLVSAGVAIEMVDAAGVAVHDLSNETVERIANVFTEHADELNLNLPDTAGLDIHLDMEWTRATDAPMGAMADILPDLGPVHTGGDIDIHLNDAGAFITCTPEFTHLLAPVSEAFVDLLATHAFIEPYASPHVPVAARPRMLPILQPSDFTDKTHWEELLRDLDLSDNDYLSMLVGDSVASTGLWLSMTEEDAVRAVGFLREQPVLGVGDHRITISEALARPFIPLDAGPWTVSLTLPWGAWNERIVVPEGRHVAIELPHQIGVPPLRVRSLNRRRKAEPVYPAESTPGWTVLTAGDTITPTSVRGGGVEGETFIAQPAPHPWRGTLWRPTAPQTATTVRFKTSRTTLETSLTPSGPVTVNLSPTYRAEPLSVVPSPHWDALVGAGQLESTDAEELVALILQASTNDLFRVAIAYACFAQNRDDLLEEVLADLESTTFEIPDVTMLRAALDWRRKTHDADVGSRLRSVQGRPPLFRWGLDVGRTGAVHYGADQLVAELEGVAARALPHSTWLLWEADK